MFLLNRKASKAPKRTLEVDHDNIPEYNDLIVDYIKQFLDAGNKIIVCHTSRIKDHS